MSTTQQRLAAAAPQPIVRYIEVCDRCGAHNSFILRCGLNNGVYYARCKKCGRNATIRLMMKPRL